MRLIILLATVVVALCFPGAVHAVDGAESPPTVDECSDGIDNDNDLLIDAVDPRMLNMPDRGCLDNTPLTEQLTYIPTLTAQRARRIARIAAGEVFEDAYEYRLVGPRVECRRLTRIRFRCELRFIYSRSLYVLRVKPRNTIVDDEAYYDYGYRGFKYHQSCLTRKYPLKCASRY